jgi:phosphoribosyl-ATP pyrophosphohydrolase
MTGVHMAQSVLTDLFAVIEQRKSASADDSYTAKLLAGGAALAGRKLTEEAVETLIAAVSESDEAVVNEAADVMYHLLVVLAVRGLSLEQVTDELQRRFGLSGLDEKASRGK